MPNNTNGEQLPNNLLLKDPGNNQKKDKGGKWTDRKKVVFAGIAVALVTGGIYGTNKFLNKNGEKNSIGKNYQMQENSYLESAAAAA